MLSSRKQKSNNAANAASRTQSVIKAVAGQTTSKKFFSALLIAGVFFAFGARPTILAQTATDLQQQKTTKQAQLDAIETKIADYQRQIKTVQGEVNNLNNQIKLLNLQIAQTEAQIEATESKIDAANLEIADVTNKIITTEKDINKQKAILKSFIF